MLIQHSSILKEEITKYLTQDIDLYNYTGKQKKYFADLTFGGGGHSLAIKEKCANAYIKAFDKDPDIIEKAKVYFQANNIDYIDLIHSDYNNFATLFNEWKEVQETGGFQGIIIDLGVSSYQLDSKTRGFSFRYDAPLDMRMNYLDGEMSAADIVNNYSEKALQEILLKYGNERFFRRIVSKIIETRKDHKIETTKELENIIFHSYPKKDRYKKRHPATKTFQALRIEVNKELESLENNIENICKTLKVGGVICVLSFHSLEDRIIKHKFKEMSYMDDFQLVEKKPIVPSLFEIDSNPRARSAKLRVLRRIDCSLKSNYAGIVTSKVKK